MLLTKFQKKRKKKKHIVHFPINRARKFPNFSASRNIQEFDKNVSKNLSWAFDRNEEDRLVFLKIFAVKTISGLNIGTMAVNIRRKKLEEDGTEEWTGLCSQLFANHTLDRCVCFRSGSRIFPVLLEPRRRRSLHKGGTRWNNTIFEEEEPERRSKLDRDWRKERRNIDFTTEGRESKRESQSGRVKETRERRTERRDDQRGEEKRRGEKERREV